MKYPLKHIIVFGILFSSFAYTQAQSLTDYEQVLKNNTITFHTEDSHKYRFDVKAGTVRPKTDRTYHWYQSRQVHVSQGGYDGKVLHGDYREFYPNNALATQGTFKNGLKSRKWSTWSEDGRLLRQSVWKKGEETGPYLLLNDDGDLVERGKYKNGKRHGRILLYDKENSAHRYQYFDHGNETTREGYYAKQPIWKRTGFYLSQQWSRLFDKRQE